MVDLRLLLPHAVITIYTAKSATSPCSSSVNMSLDTLGGVENHKPGKQVGAGSDEGAAPSIWHAPDRCVVAGGTHALLVALH